MDKYFENKNLFSLLFKWRFHLIIITVVAGVLAVVFSGPAFIAPLFKSYALVYPSNINPYSDESETEQMLQILQSNDIKDSVIAKFDLAKHYEVDQDYKYFRSTLLYEYDDHVKTKKTPYESVEIEVLDKDPQMASNMVEAILYYYNKKVSKLHKEKWLEVVKIYDGQLKRKARYIDSLKSVMKDIGENYGLYEYSTQSEEITKGLLKTVSGSNASQINDREVRKLNDAMKRKGGDLITLVELLRQEARTYADVKLDYEQATRFYTDKLTYTNVITPPFPADKKVYPIRWLILVITLIATFFFASLIIVILENYRNFINVRFDSQKKQDLETN